MSERRHISLTRRAIGAIGMLGFSQCVNIICSVIRVKLSAIWLGTVGVGLNSIYLNASTLVSNLTQLNIRDSAVRDIASSPDDPAFRCSLIRRVALMLGLIGAAAIVLISPLLSYISFGDLSHTIYFAMLFPAVLFSACSAGEFAIMQGRGRLDVMARASVEAVVCATVIAAPLLYFLRLDAVVPVIDLYIVAMAAFAYIRRERLSDSSLKTYSVSAIFALARPVLVLGAVMSFSSMLVVLIQYILTSYISRHGSASDVGIYQAGFMLLNNYIGILFAAVTAEYFPRISRFVRRPNMSRTIVSHELNLITWLIIPLAVIFVCLVDLIVPILFSSDFEAVGPFVTVAVVGVLFRGVSLCFVYRILAGGDSKAYLTVECLSAVIGLAANIIGYTYWSYVGLGLSYVLWYGCYALLTAGACHWRYGLKLSRVNILSVVFGVAVIALAIVLKIYLSSLLAAVIILPWLIPLTLLAIRHRRLTPARR